MSNNLDQWKASPPPEEPEKECANCQTPIHTGIYCSRDCFNADML